MGDKSRHGKLEENVTRDSGQMRDGARTEAGVEIELRQGKDRKKSSIQKVLIPEHGIVGIQLRRGRCDGVIAGREAVSCVLWLQTQACVSVSGKIRAKLATSKRRHSAWRTI